jgi:ubiquitin carboxyl-terminal hydrolase 14
MNATVQVLGAVPELHTALDLYEGQGDPNASLVASLRDLYSNMAKTTEGFPPIQFLQNLRVVQPRFNEVRQGVPVQQGSL